jgi:SpoVK/Ycf46/Vps4 family AAA+-type ATPase
MAMPSGSATAPARAEVLAPAWHERLSRLISRGRKTDALAFLERTIERGLPLFRKDRAIFESRRAAWLVRTHLLLEWNRPAEALAWTCLECQLADAPADAKALRDRLLRQLDLDFESTDEAASEIATETQWPGVAGMYELKAKLERDLILPLRHPEEARRYDIPLPNGILLYGPPGCGKTFIARKIAEKLGFKFVEVKPGDLANQYVHGTQEMIRDVFAQAEQDAPAVLFFDEFDAFAASRTTAGHHYAAEVTEFLVRLDHCGTKRILVIAATNYPEKLDAAALRPGRLDQHYLVGLPDFAARTELFRTHMAKRPSQGLDWNLLATASEGYTAADIEYLCTQAARIAFQEKRRIALKHVQAAMREHPVQTHPVRTPIGFTADR